ncbi:GNAT family N-acetyltransferase [soil metagenome]
MSGVRRVGAEAASVLAQVHAQGFERGWSSGEIAALLDQPGVIGLAVGDPAAGFILIRTVVDEAEILTLAVDPARRGQGLGGALTDAALELARAEGVASIFLEVAADNTAAIRIYERLAFTNSGVRRGYYSRANNSSVDALILTCDLNSRET